MRGSANKAEKKQTKGWLVHAAAVDDTLIQPRRWRLRPPSPVMVLLALLAILAGIALWIVPELQIAPARDRLAGETLLTASERLILENDLFQAANAARSTLALIFGASGLLLGLGIAWRRYEISRELRTHERFARAVEQLASERGDGSARTEARLGGIYALERLAAESEREYWPVMEVLTAYVRQNAPWKPGERSLAVGPQRPSADIQAIIAVLGRRKPHAASIERRLLDLRETDLRGANLSGSRLDGVTLQGAHLDQVDATRATLARSNLREATLSGASMTQVDLEGASLSRANLEGARLNGANLKGADLSGANLRGADLWEANVKNANLKDADLRGADLSQCMLEEAIMWRADLQDAVLTGARLREAHLERANLAGAVGLTWEQGDDAYTDENTVLPEYLVPQVARPAGEAEGSLAVLPPPPPTPAARRSPRAAARSAVPTPLTVPVTMPMPLPKDNVVQLKPVDRRQPTPTRNPPPHTDGQLQPTPKKAGLPKHRKPGMVKPA